MLIQSFQFWNLLIKPLEIHKNVVKKIWSVHAQLYLTLGKWFYNFYKYPYIFTQLNILSYLQMCLMKDIFLLFLYIFLMAVILATRIQHEEINHHYQGNPIIENLTILLFSYFTYIYMYKMSYIYMYDIKKKGYIFY